MELFSRNLSRFIQSLKLTAGLVLLTALAICAGERSFAAHNFPGGDGSPGNPFWIMTAEDLDHVRDDLDAHYVLKANIDLSAFGEWQPIGTGTAPFSGVFDGGDFKIAGLTITVDDGKELYGLFGYTSNAVLQNLHLRDVHIDVAGGGSSVGALAGGLLTTTVRNVSVTGTVRSDHIISLTGGIAGAATYISISDSFSTAEVSGGEYVGGLFGRLFSGTVERSYAAGNAAGHNVGGLIGSIDAAIIANSYALGNATSDGASGAAGGLVGKVMLGIVDSEVRDSYAMGRADGVTAGGLIGKIHTYETIGSLSLTHVYWNAVANPGHPTIGGEPGNTESRDPDDLKKEDTFDGWDFTGVWGIAEDQSTPYLLVFKPEIRVPSGHGTPVFSAVDGFNKVTVTGHLLDPSIGEMLELRYEVKDDQDTTIAAGVYGTEWATGSEQPFTIELDIVDDDGPLDLPEGRYTLEISVADTVAGLDPAHRTTAEFPFEVDRTPPDIELNGDAVVKLTEGGTYTEPGATATDDREGDLTGHIVITGTVNPNVPGTYNLTYRVQDSAGNAAEVTRTVVVNARPVLGAYVLSDNNRLESLKLLDGSLELELTPAFSETEPAYEAETEKDRLTLAAKPEHYAAKVTVNGEPLPDDGLEVSLEPGENAFNIAVRAENGDVRTYTLTIRRTEAAAEPVTPACPFEDVRGHWAEAILCDAFELGLVQGVSAARFAPDLPVTRLELALMLERLVGSVDAAPPAPLPFADASDIPAWAEEAIRSAYVKGIVKGYPDGTLRPHRLVSRIEMAAMLASAARTVKPDDAWPDMQRLDAAIERFPDASAISAWARDYAGLAAAQGWMQGRGGGRFEPQANATRAEAAATILRLWKTLQS